MCGQTIKEGNKFCGKCGTAIGTVVKPNVKTDTNLKQSSSSKIASSYIVSIICAVISFIIRIATQQTYYSWSNLLDNRKVIGIDSDVKPFLTALPVVATIVISILVISDNKVSSQKKITTLIINAIFIILAILFIWFDIPYAIIDF